MAGGQPIATEPDGGQSAELLVRFVNTRAAGNGQPELIGDGAALRAWFGQEGLAAAGGLVTNADAATTRELREALAVLLVDHVGGAPSSEATTDAEVQLSRFAELHPVRLVVRADGCTPVPSQTGVAGALGAILAAVLQASSAGWWDRTKMCSNPPCHAGFVDRTRNSAGRYCSATCRSQMSMRALRQRRRSDET